ncbi:DUF3972 domain-containing protein [Sulfurovum sp. zt1-1]|uniref:DUF3972 domain-containing protein n=1 Tax=Sulfurovum zhangzhouensis TaxID=3019067 RepID=A0ABT7R179_9BACT|nr:DUF3972 domain-containing protein [Sulfurovum zhangzhouensis]MDM5272559.1 DUF3972 domain-containing protein [Sulfurovum zhangzhouensis]
METLMKPAEYAKELGISRQAVYAKIKKGLLTAKEVEGKLYIVVDTKTAAQAAPQISPLQSTQSKPENPSSSKSKAIPQEYQKLLAAKDETIAVLKETVEDLKESNKQISTTLKGEIDLLKSAFSEMRSLYVHRIEQLKEVQIASSEEEILEADVKHPEQAETLQEWIGTKRFLRQQNVIKEKQKEKILKKLKKAYKNGDERLSKIDGKLKIDATKAYEDILS